MELTKSISFKQDELLESMFKLYCGTENLCADLTYGYGGFYKKIPGPRFKFDLDVSKRLKAPGEATVVAASATAVPVRARAFQSVMLDPPFLVGSSCSGSIMSKRYGGFTSLQALLTFSSAAASECRRILKRYGILFFKCQDFVLGRSNVFAHCLIKDAVEAQGFTACDLFILCSTNRMTAWNYVKQHHARKFHSYFWVFRKTDKEPRAANA